MEGKRPRWLGVGYWALVVLTALVMVSGPGGDAVAATGPEDAADKELRALPCGPCRVMPHPGWSANEKWVWARVCQGLDVDFNAKLGTKPVPWKAEDWCQAERNKRRLSSSFLRTILTRQPWKMAIPEYGAKIFGAIFEEAVNLSSANISSHLWLENCRMEHGVLADHLKSTGSLSFDNSFIAERLNLFFVELNSDLSLQKSHVEACSLEWARIYGPICMMGASFGQELNMDNLQLRSSLLMNESANFQGEIYLRSARIGGQLAMEGSTFWKKLNMDSLQVALSIFMGNQANFMGEIDMRAARVIGSLNMMGSLFLKSVILEQVNVGTNLFLHNHSMFTEEVSLKGAKIGGQVVLNSSEFKQNINLIAIRVGSNLFMCEKAQFMGKVILTGARIGGQLAMDNSTFLQDLILDAVQVTGSLFMRDQATFKGDVDVRFSRVGGQIVMENSMFQRKVIMDKLEANAGLLMTENTLFMGDVILVGAKINSQLSMDKSIFKQQLHMDSLVVDGGLFMRGIVAEKKVKLIFSKVELLLQLSGAKINEIDLTGSKVGGVICTKNDWQGKLKVDGFTYKHLGGMGEEYFDQRMTDWPAEWFISWLARQEVYSPQPYEQCAEVLREAGQPDKANDILFAGRERERKAAWGQSFSQWVWLSMLRYTIGYGLGRRYFLSLVWLVLFTGLGMLVVAKTPLAAKHSWGWIAGFSLAKLLPLVDFGKNFDEIVHGWQQGYFIFHQLMGWVLASFIVAGLAGLTK